MRADPGDGGTSVLPVATAALAAGVIVMAARRFVLEPLLGSADGRDGSMLLLFFLVGVLAFPLARRGPGASPSSVLRRLLSGLLYAILAAITIVLPDRLWP